MPFPPDPWADAFGSARKASVAEFTRQTLPGTRSKRLRAASSRPLRTSSEHLIRSGPALASVRDAGPRVCADSDIKLTAVQDRGLEKAMGGRPSPELR